MRILVTGAAGFIGSNFVHFALREHPDWRVLALDKLTYAGNLRNLEAARDDPRFTFVQMDICAPAISEVLEGCDALVNFAAETHVDRSIEDAAAFVRTNVEGTLHLLEATRRSRIGRFLQISTDEVYGTLGPNGSFRETSSLAPNSPYAASKASADLLVRAYVQTYAVPAVITRCSNNYGPYQFPEKFIPLMVVQAVAGQSLPIYGDGRQVRDWVHVEDHCRAISMVLQRGRVGDVYNIGGNCEMENIKVAELILHNVGRPRNLVKHVADRPGHDRRYAINCDKIQAELGWTQHWNFNDGLAHTIKWYREHHAWLEDINTGAYREYLKRHYDNRDATMAVVRGGGQS